VADGHGEKKDECADQSAGCDLSGCEFRDHA